jgi:CheY-like chemotaxis protein
LPAIYHVKIYTKIFRFDPEAPTRTFPATNSSAAFWSTDSNGARLRGEGHDSSQSPEAPLIYVVDDLPCLAELYVVLLEADGFRVRAFGNRKAACAALNAGEEKPSLLITDYRNTSMSTDQFLGDCHALHSSLRILMATGFDRCHARTVAVTPHRFLQKPFTPDELRAAVRAILTAETPENCAR